MIYRLSNEVKVDLIGIHHYGVTNWVTDFISITTFITSSITTFITSPITNLISNLVTFLFQIEIKSSVDNETVLYIHPGSKFLGTENIWVQAELYFYGTLINAGGKSSINIHLDKDEFGSLSQLILISQSHIL